MAAQRVNRALAVAGLSAGQLLPAMFLGAALPAIYREQGFDLRSLWIFFLPQLPAWIKWLWAPLVDRFGHPGFGRRKSWILPMTALASALYLGLTLIEPTLAWLNILIALLIARSFLTSVLDVAIDAYTVEAYAHAPPEGASVVGIAEQLAPIVATSGLLVVYDRFGWDAAIYAAVAGLILCTVPAALRREEPPRVAAPPASLGRFIRRRDSPLILFAVPALSFAIYFPVLADSVFLVDRGFSLAESGVIVGLGQGAGYFVGLAAAPFILGWSPTAARLAAFAAALAPLGPMALSLVEVGVAQAAAVYFASALLLSPLIVEVNARRIMWADRGQPATDFAIQSATTPE
jgi:MFS family permease